MGVAAGRVMSMSPVWCRRLLKLVVGAFGWCLTVGGRWWLVGVGGEETAGVDCGGVSREGVKGGWLGVSWHRTW